MATQLTTIEVSRPPRPKHWDKALTPRQAAIFAFIRRYVRDEEQPPTTAEVAAALSETSPAAARYNLKALAKADYLVPVTEGGLTRWSPTGDRAVAEANIWRLVDEGIVTWSGGKPKGSRRGIKVLGEGFVSDFVHEDRR